MQPDFDANAAFARLERVEVNAFHLSSAQELRWSGLTSRRSAMQPDSHANAAFARLERVGVNAFHLQQKARLAAGS
jgi:hypothetical protein